MHLTTLGVALIEIERCKENSQIFDTSYWECQCLKKKKRNKMKECDRDA